MRETALKTGKLKQEGVRMWKFVGNHNLLCRC